jgi:hypothetical protein
MKPQVEDLVELKEKHPELVAQGYLDPAKFRYFVPTWDKRSSNMDVGNITRPF